MALIIAILAIAWTACVYLLGVEVGSVRNDDAYNEACARIDQALEREWTAAMRARQRWDRRGKA